MAIRILRDFTKRMFSLFFQKQREIKLGFYGPPNAGKTSLANRICKDWTGEEIGTVSNIPHETRHVQFKEEVEIKYKEKTLKFKLIDTPGIATKIDYEDFVKLKMNKKQAQKRAKEATQGIVEAIKYLYDIYVNIFFSCFVCFLFSFFIV